jgi:hypothetical protein
MTVTKIGYTMRLQTWSLELTFEQKNGMQHYIGASETGCDVDAFSVKSQMGMQKTAPCVFKAHSIGSQRRKKEGRRAFEADDVLASKLSTEDQ